MFNLYYYALSQNRWTLNVILNNKYGRLCQLLFQIFFLERELLFLLKTKTID